MTRRIVFHIGLAKTGTTSVQNFCSDNRARLAAGGLLYPRRQIGRARNHSPLAASYIAHRPEGPSVAVRWAPRAEAVADLSSEIAAHPARQALVSSEHFSTHFDRSEALDLAADFALFDTEVVIALRDAHARFLSSYNTHVTAGGTLTIEAFARSMLIPGTRFMNARVTLEIWAEAFGFERVRVVDYDAEPDMIGAVLTRCGIETLPVPARPYRDRPSLGPVALDALRLANLAIRTRQTASPDADLAAALQLNAASLLARRHIVRGSLHTGARPWTLSPRTMAALDAIADDDRRFVQDRFGVALRGASARKRIVVAEPDDVAEAAACEMQAGQTIPGVPKAFWPASEAAVRLWRRLDRERRWSR